MLDATVLESGVLGADVVQSVETHDAQAAHEMETREAQLVTAVESSLKRWLGSRRMPEIEFDGNVIRLSGSMSTYYQKQLASHGAMAAADGYQVVNDIVVS